MVGRAPHRGSGPRRDIAPVLDRDLAEVAVICELRRRGFSLQRVRKVVRFLQREFSKRLAETVTGSSDYHLLTDGRTLYPGNIGPADRGHPERIPVSLCWRSVSAILCARCARSFRKSGKKS